MRARLVLHGPFADPKTVEVSKLGGRTVVTHGDGVIQLAVLVHEILSNQHQGWSSVTMFSWTGVGRYL